MAKVKFGTLTVEITPRELGLILAALRYTSAVAEFSLADDSEAKRLIDELEEGAQR